MKVYLFKKPINKIILAVFAIMAAVLMCLLVFNTENPISRFVDSRRSNAEVVTLSNNNKVKTGHSLLISGSSHERIAVVDYDGSTVWELKQGNLWLEVNDADMDENGNIIYAARSSGGSYVQKIKPDYNSGGYEEVWKYTVPSGAENHTSQILSNGNVLICEAYSDHIRLIELNASGGIDKIIGENNIEGFDNNLGSHNQIRQAFKTDDGTYLLSHFTEDITYEIDSSGKTVKTYPFGKGFTAVKDKDKNIIISGGNQSEVRSYNQNGELLWSIKKDDISGITLGFPAAVVPLDNGNILLANWGGHGGSEGESAVVEIDPDKKELIWYMDTDDSMNISNVYLLDSFSDSINPAVDVYRSPIDVAASTSDNVAYVADQTGKKIIAVSGGGNVPVAVYSIPESPNSILVSPNGKVVYCVCGEKNGKLIALNTDTGKILNTVTLGHTPSSICSDGEFNNLYVTNRFDSTVMKIALNSDGSAGNIITSEKITREPITAAFAGSKLYVGGHLPNTTADSENVAAEVCVLDAENLELEKSIELPDGSTGLKRMAASPDGKFVYATHTVGRYWVPPTQLDRGWIYTNAITEINALTSERSATILLDDMDKGAGNPWGVYVTQNNIVVSTSGTGEVIIIDRSAMREQIEAVYSGKYIGDGSVTSVDEITNSLTFLSSIKKRVSVGSSGTKGVSVLGGKIYAANYYSGSITVIDLDNAEKIKDIQLYSDAEDSDARIGEKLWNDASLCFGSWMSCASCHIDGRVDGLNWDISADNFGTFKQTRTMLDTFKRGRVISTGSVSDAATNVEHSMTGDLFNNAVSEEQCHQVNEYLKSLKPVESPYRNSDGTLTESAMRGKSLFEGKAGCISCHSGEIKGQDKLIYNNFSDERGTLIPPLREVWRTAPYFYNGSVLTIDEVLERKINSGYIGDITLTAAEQQDIVEYVMSLDGNTDAFPWGDINGDWDVDIRDLVRMKKNFAASKYPENSDLNNDGKINTDDMVVLRKYLIGAN